MKKLEVNLIPILDNYFKYNGINIVKGNDTHTISNDTSLMNVSKSFKYFLDNMQINVKAGVKTIDLMYHLPNMKKGYSSPKGFTLLLCLYMFFRITETKNNDDAILLNKLYGDGGPRSYNYLYSGIDNTFIDIFANTLVLLQNCTASNTFIFVGKLVQYNCEIMTTEQILNNDVLLDVIANDEISKEIILIEEILFYAICLRNVAIKSWGKFTLGTQYFKKIYCIYDIMYNDFQRHSNNSAGFDAQDKKLVSSTLLKNPNINKVLFYILIKDTKSVKTLSYMDGTRDAREDHCFVLMLAVSFKEPEILQYVIDNIIYRTFLEKLVYLQQIENYELHNNLYWYSRSLCDISIGV